LVKGKDESRSNSVEAVLCQFKLPEESKGGKYAVKENDGYYIIINYIRHRKYRTFILFYFTLLTLIGTNEVRLGSITIGESVEKSQGII